jgi:hypothetical protein
VIDLIDIWTDLKENWSKYGVLVLIFKEFRILYHTIDKFRTIKDNLSWMWKKFTWPFKKVYYWIRSLKK